MSTVVANVSATIPSYYLNRKWVWGKSGRSHLMKEIVPFWCMAAIGITVSIGGAAVARHIGIEHHLSHFDQTLLVLAANVFSFGLFWSSSTSCSTACSTSTRWRSWTSWSKRPDPCRSGPCRPVRPPDHGPVMTATVTHSGSAVLVIAVFLASAVEMVEALTIVLAAGLTRGWRSALEGVAVAAAALARSSW